MWAYDKRIMTLIDTLRSPQRAMYNYDIARREGGGRVVRRVGMAGLAMVGVLMLSAESPHVDHPDEQLEVVEAQQ